MQGGPSARCVFDTVVLGRTEEAMTETEATLRLDATFTVSAKSGA